MSESPRVGSAVIVEDGNSVLVGRRGKQPNFGRWVLPGGKVELFESLDEAARREVAEETGLQIEVTERIGVFEIIERTGGEHRLIVFTRARCVGGSLRAGSDLLEVRFVDGCELPRFDLTPVVRSALRKAGWLGGAANKLRRGPLS